MVEIIPNWHPLFVHFTVALVSVSSVLFIILKIFGVKWFSGELLIFARWALLLGAIFGVITVIAGFDAYNSVAHDAPSHAAMQTHRDWALATLTILLVCTIWSLFNHMRSIYPTWGFTLATLVLLTFLVSTAWRGGELVYRHGLGVMSLPQQSESNEDGHNHEHSYSKIKGKPDVKPQPRSHGADSYNHKH